jgi:hypothetical protein
MDCKTNVGNGFSNIDVGCEVLVLRALADDLPRQLGKVINTKAID